MQFLEFKRISKKSWVLVNSNIEDAILQFSERFFYFDLSVLI